MVAPGTKALNLRRPSLASSRSTRVTTSCSTRRASRSSLSLPRARSCRLRASLPATLRTSLNRFPNRSLRLRWPSLRLRRASNCCSRSSRTLPPRRSRTRTPSSSLTTCGVCSAFAASARPTRSRRLESGSSTRATCQTSREFPESASLLAHHPDSSAHILSMTLLRGQQRKYPHWCDERRDWPGQLGHRLFERRGGHDPGGCQGLQGSRTAVDDRHRRECCAPALSLL